MLKRLLTLSLSLLSLGARAQSASQPTLRSYPEHHVGFRCAFDSVQQAAFRRAPGAEARYQGFLRAAMQLSPPEQARLLAQPDVTVPVVMHIIHTGGADNITDAQVYDALRIVNEDFSKRNPDTLDVIAPFRSRYANVGFRFRLAKIDPNGNCTTGITRTYSNETNVGDDRVKSLITWDQGRYLNIWVTTNANGAGGYAYLPCTGGAGDGIVIRAAQFGSIGQSNSGNFSKRSLTHEIGHFFGLPHTWGPSNTPGLASNCGIDDGITDTPNTIGILGGCDLTFSPCSSNGRPVLSNVQNYMDYSGCTCMFTTDQRTVMRSSLQLPCRDQLTSPANLLATGTNDGYVSTPCAPVVAFRPSVTRICEGGTVTFTEYSYNADLSAANTTFSWSFPGGSPTTSTDRQPTVTYTNSGIYDATLTATTANGLSNTLTLPQLVQVIGANTGLRTPVAESFENQTFPNNFPAGDLRNWESTSTVTSGLARWQRMPAIAGRLVPSDGMACVAVRSNQLPNNTITWLTSPNIDLSSFSAANPPVVIFDRAYALRPTSAADNLSVQFSTDCGVTWLTRASYGAVFLNTVDTLRSLNYSPASLNDWQPLSVTVPASDIGSRFQVRFQLTSRRGNTIYLDHVRVGALPAATQTAGATRYNLQLYPNPRTAATEVHLTLPTAATVHLELRDALGRTVASTLAGRYSAGEQHLSVPCNPLPAGLYLVQVVVNDKRIATKLVVQ
jgi:hypothetical protein